MDYTRLSLAEVVSGRSGRSTKRQAARAIMTSPFISVVTYSVLDGCRLVLAHDRRHIEQARRMVGLPAFPCAR